MKPAWVPAVDHVGEFVQANLGGVKQIEAIATQGRYDFSQWVTSYKFAYSVVDDDDVTYDYVMNADDDTNERVFSGNSDGNTVVVNDVIPPIAASRYVRLYPQTYQTRMALRWEVYGCT